MPQQQASSTTKWHIQTMREIEEQITANLQKKLPALKQLARLAGMSTSSLTSHFKAVYGSTVRSYYLGKRMEWARKLLQEKGYNVNETAYALGYHKVSVFIIMFKKYQKSLPSSFKPKNELLK